MTNHLKNFGLFLCLAACLTFTVVSCSTIINGSKQDVSIKSTPADADIYVDGDKVGQGSATVKLRRGKDHIIEVKKSGYKDSRITTDKSIASWFWGNIICGGVPGGVIDFVTGSAWDIDPGTVIVTLDKGTGSLEQALPENFGNLEVKSASGETLAALTVNWQ